MSAQTTRGITFTAAGVGIGLMAGLAVRLIAGFFMNLPVDLASLSSFGIAGIIMGAYFGYVLSHFNYEALFKHTDPSKKS